MYFQWADTRLPGTARIPADAGRARLLACCRQPGAVPAPASRPPGGSTLPALAGLGTNAAGRTRGGGGDTARRLNLLPCWDGGDFRCPPAGEAGEGGVGSPRAAPPPS